MESAPVGAGDRPSDLGYVPALDGLRAVAVAAVLVFHHDPSWLPGGFLGVSLFFTLSGFLITRLLVDERARTGHVRLGAFWGRRARRLLPASWLTLGLAVVVADRFVPSAQRGAMLLDVRAALANVANWRFVLSGAGYADVSTIPSVVQHYWSLAIEEQFYLVFPLVVAVAGRRRRVLAGVLAGAALGSIALQVWIDDPTRVYFGTDTRIAELAVGCLLALALGALPSRAGGRLDRAAPAIGVAGIAAAGAVVAAVDLQSRFLYDGGLAALSLLWCTLLVGALHQGGGIARPLAWRPVVAVGRISYGVYLIHFPVFIVLTPDRVGVGGIALFALRVAVVLVAATVSFVLVEQPIRQRRLLPRPLAPALVGAGLAAIVLAGTVVFAPPPSIVAAGYQYVPAPPPTAGNADRDVPRLLVVGDSTAGATGRGLQDWGRRTGRVAVSVLHRPACTTLPGTSVVFRAGWIYDPGCDDLAGQALRVAEVARPDAVVVFLGSAQLGVWRYGDLDGWHSLADAEVVARYRDAVAAFLARLGELDVPILWADLPPVHWDLDRFSEIQGTPAPGSGPSGFDDPHRWAVLDALDAELLGTAPQVDRWPYTSVLAGDDGEIPADIRPDGLHLSPEAGVALGPDLFAAIHAAYERVVAEAASTPARTRIVWDLSPA